jgi:hypothetical protein
MLMSLSYMSPHSQERSQASNHLVEHIGRHRSSQDCLPGAPIHTPDVIGENDTANGEARRQRDLEWIILDLAGNRTDQRQPDPTVVASRRKD